MRQKRHNRSRLGSRNGCCGNCWRRSVTRPSLPSSGPEKRSQEEPDGTHTLAEAIRFRVSDRGTLWKILVDRFFQFPEAYCNGRLTFDGDLETLTGLIAESAALSPQGTRLLTYAAKLLHWGGAIRWPPHRSTFNTITTLATIFIVCGWMKACFTRARTSSSRPPRSNSATCEDGSRVPQARTPPGRNSDRSGLRLGRFALHMAKHYGVRVRAYNISREQVAEARHRAKTEGLDDRVEFVLEDWRKITGTCDVFVSIGMLEHVGTANYRQLGDVIDGCLARDGRGLIHTIGRNRAQPLDPWIERRIFPVAYPPSLKQMTAIFEPCEFSLLDVENIRLHYAETLRHWLSRY